MRLNTIYKPNKRVTLKRLNAVCNDLNNELKLNNKRYNKSGQALESYQISAAYGGYKLEYWNNGGAYDQTHRTTAKELYLIIIAILSGLKAR
jgi:hypothetical protein